MPSFVVRECHARGGKKLIYKIMKVKVVMCKRESHFPFPGKQRFWTNEVSAQQDDMKHEKQKQNAGTANHKWQLVPPHLF